MDIDQIRHYQAIGYILFVVFLVFVLYGYFFHLHKTERKGERNYEKYGRLALDDEIDDEPIEPLQREEKENR